MKAMKAVIWCLVGNGTRGTAIEEIGGGVKGFDPKFWWHAGLDNECTDDVVCGADGMLGFAVLWQCGKLIII